MSFYRVLITLTFLAAPVLAQADLVPLYLHQVVGVAENDSLNIRSQPNAGAEIVGTLAPDSFIDVLEASPDGRWALVSSDSSSGWVSARFLRITERQNPTPFGPAPPLPSVLICQSSSPVWDATLSTSEGFITYEIENSPWYAGAEGTQRRISPVTYATTAQGRNYDKFLFTAGQYTGVLTRARCDDEETARHYAWALDLILFRSAGSSMLSGCCRAAQP